MSLVGQGCARGAHRGWRRPQALQQNAAVCVRQTQVQQHGVKPLGAQSAPSTGHIATHPRHNRVAAAWCAGLRRCLHRLQSPGFAWPDCHRKPQQVRFASIKTGLSATFNVAGMQQSSFGRTTAAHFTTPHPGGHLASPGSRGGLGCRRADLAWANAFGTPGASLCASTGFCASDARRRAPHRVAGGAGIGAERVVAPGDSSPPGRQ